MRSNGSRLAGNFEGNTVIQILSHCSARQFLVGKSVCTHEANANRVLSLTDCTSCPLVGLTARTDVPIPRSETLRSGNVVRTVPCPDCLGHVRLKVR